MKGKGREGKKNGYERRTEKEKIIGKRIERKKNDKKEKKNENE